jgi:hypothetical protein
VVSVLNTKTDVTAGEIGKPLSGTVTPEAIAIAIGVEGDVAHWIVPTGAPTLDAPTLPSFEATLSFSAGLPAGPRNLVVRATSTAGELGPPTLVPLLVTAAPVPSGALVVSLRWDTEADLDLHVIDASGVEIWARNVNSFVPPPPGAASDRDAWKTGGILDFDSNAGCQIDGRCEENVVWTEVPPAGRYVVRVDTASLCRETTARWSVTVTAAGVPIARAQGQSLPTDTRASKGPGSGLTALELSYPPP